MLHLFFIFVSISLALGGNMDGPLTETKGRELMMSSDCNMLSMLPTKQNEGEEYGLEEAFADYQKMGLRPREASLKIRNNKKKMKNRDKKMMKKPFGKG